ncbi:hypothetical protein BKA93DRAFT_882355 [Sparassis latifolia]
MHTTFAASDAQLPIVMVTRSNAMLRHKVPGQVWMRLVYRANFIAPTQRTITLAVKPATAEVCLLLSQKAKISDQRSELQELKEDAIDNDECFYSDYFATTEVAQCTHGSRRAPCCRLNTLTVLTSALNGLWSSFQLLRAGERPNFRRFGNLHVWNVFEDERFVVQSDASQ